MARTLYGFGQGSSGLTGRVVKAPAFVFAGKDTDERPPNDWDRLYDEQGRQQADYLHDQCPECGRERKGAQCHK